MKKPGAQRLGKPFCHNQLMFIIQENGGSITRSKLRSILSDDGYTKYGIYEAFRRCSDKGWITFEGSGTSPNQKVILTEQFYNSVE